MLASFSFSPLDDADQVQAFKIIKTEASTATIQSATHAFKASEPYEESATPMRFATFSMPFALARPVGTGNDPLMPSLPNLRGGSRMDKTLAVLKMPDFTVGAAVGRPCSKGNFFLVAERACIPFYKQLASR
ncbi:hypothetical protein [Mesorhizobium sp. WSM3860]|uniref:hypothetical protein n=1 Tax=Mesorhizobium sp. WSM3860 TaxID=2029403 RepID=UPI000BB05608|nr:hypothetical protein [Mesorhizobium sp. WSM3860]PBC00895.1 hypothetical protein CK220_28640 [Mesorhizobium sp. WSM3860]